MLLRRVADIRGGEGIEIPEKICFFEHNPPSEPKILRECCFAKGFFKVRYLQTERTEVVNVCAVYPRTVRICWGRKGSGGGGDEFINLNSAVREKRRRRCFHRNQGCNFCLQRGGGERRKTVSTTFSVFLKQLFLSLRFFPKICDFFSERQLLQFLLFSHFPFTFSPQPACFFPRNRFVSTSSHSLVPSRLLTFGKNMSAPTFASQYISRANVGKNRMIRRKKLKIKLLLAGPIMSSKYKYNLHRKTVP